MELKHVRRWRWPFLFKASSFLVLSIGVHFAGTLACVAAASRPHFDRIGETPCFGGDRDDLITRNSITEYFSCYPGVIGFLLLWPAMCLVTALLQRGQKDRYDGLALLACALAVPGGFISIFSTNISASFGWYRPIELLQLGIALLGASSLAGLVSLVRLVITRSERRGRVFGLFCFVWGAFFAGFTYFFVLYQRCADTDPPGMEFPVAESSLFAYLARDKWPTFMHVVWIDDAGGVRLDGEELWRPTDGDRVEELRAALENMAARMPKDKGVPDEVLHLRADGRAPAAAVARFLELCDGDEVGIWKFKIAVSGAPYLQTGACDWYESVASIGRRKTPSDELEEAEEGNSWVRIALVDSAGSDSDGGVLFRYMDETLESPADVFARMSESSSAKVNMALSEIVIDPDLSWDAALGAITRLQWQANQLNPASSFPMLELGSIHLLRD